MDLNEAWRRYRYWDRTEVYILKPRKLTTERTDKGGTGYGYNHHVEDITGRTHFVPRGWAAIESEPEISTI